MKPPESLALRVLFAGPGCTVQDTGRHGYLRYGITAAGPMDPFTQRFANRLLANDDNHPTIEISTGGLDVTAVGDTLAVALAGHGFEVIYADQPVPLPARLRLEPGLTLTIRAGAAGAWCYLAVLGGLNVPLLLGSAATHTRSQMGGWHGRALTKTDILPVFQAAPTDFEAGQVTGSADAATTAPIRVLLGPQADYFSADSIAQYLATPWRLSSRCDRMAYFLEGEPLRHARGYNITSDGIAMGAIQVPGDGQPIVLMADRQSTGGYPKIATVIGPDLGRLAQTRPGEEIRFQAVSHAEALVARRDEQTRLAAPHAIVPLHRDVFPTAYVLRTKLVDGYFHD